MSRIRSVHPGIWTDEAFMSLSCHGRLMLIGLWTEAFDDGVFEWKPLTLKARLFPADAVDVELLLAELVGAGVIARIDTNEKRAGVIRNFQKFQRPKKPNSSGLLPSEWLGYVKGSEPVPHQFPTSGGKSPQMEDGGGRREKETTPNGVVSSTPRDQIDVIKDKLLEAVGEKIQPHGAIVIGPILELIAQGADLETDVLPVIAARSARMTEPAGSWTYFVKAIREAHNRRVEAGKGLSRPKVSAIKSDDDMSPEELRGTWQKRLDFARPRREWPSWLWGPMPGQPGCRIPSDMLVPGDGKQFDGEPWRDMKQEAA